MLKPKREPEEPAGLWSRRYRAMSMGELAVELARLASEAVRHDYDKRRHFILQEFEQRTTRP